MKRLKQLGKDSVIYGLGGILAKGIGFFLLPVYTRIFTPADYGTIEMMSVIVSLLTSFLAMGMDSAQSFYFFEQKEKGKSSQVTVISAILQWRLTWGLGIVLIAGTSAPLINSWFFNGKLPWIYFGVSFAGALFVTVMNQSVGLFRLLYRPWSYISVTMIQTILGAGLVLFFVLVLGQGVFSFFLGTAISALATAIFGWYRVRDYLDFYTWHFQWWPRLLKYGAPLLPAGLAIYVMSTADRWFIQHYHGAEVLGVYAVGAKFAMLMALGIDTFRKAWWPIAMDAMHSDDGPETFRMISRLFMGVGVAAVVYLTFLSPWLVRWLTGPSFNNAWPIVGIVAWKSLFYGFFLISCPGIWKAEKTYITAINMAIAGSVNIGLNFLWVPQYGGMGAALATALTYLLWIVISMIISEQLWPVQFPVTLLLGQIGLGAIIVGWLTLAGSDVYMNAAVVHVSVGILIFSSFDHIVWQKIAIKSGGLWRAKDIL